MVTIKSYSDLQQSKKLAEILPLESADMYYAMTYTDAECNRHYNTPARIKQEYTATYETDIPCWSLAALLSVLPKDEGIDCSISFGYYNGKGEYIEKWLCAFEKEGETTDGFILETIDGDNPIDACYELILKLHELKML